MKYIYKDKGYLLNTSHHILKELVEGIIYIMYWEPSRISQKTLFNLCF